MGLGEGLLVSMVLRLMTMFMLVVFWVRMFDVLMGGFLGWVGFVGLVGWMVGFDC